MTASARVAVLRTRPETVLDDYRRLFELAGGAEALDPAVPTILKDNISWHYPMPSANTTPWQLEGTILALRQAGYDELVCVQNKTVVISALKGEDLNGYVPILRSYSVPVLYNFKREDMSWVLYRPKATMRALDKVFPKGIYLPDFFFGKNIVHLPTTKCHLYTTTTGAIKNAFGGLLNHHRHYAHSWIHETIVDLLAIQKEIHAGLFAVMDGTTAGNGPGPRTMTPVVKNVILASADQVAIDAVSAKMMGFDPLAIPYIRMAHESGLGCGDVREVEMVGDDVSGENWQFQVGRNLHGMLAWLAWVGPTRHLQKLVLHTPLVAIPTFISAANHDYIHWPLKEKHVYEDWRANTPWGQLFERYQREGCLIQEHDRRPAEPATRGASALPGRRSAMNIRSVSALFDIAIGNEESACALYRDLARQFAHVAEVADFWRLMAGEEEEHAAELKRLRSMLSPDQLQGRAGRSLAGIAARGAEHVATVPRATIRTLDDAYRLVKDLEGSEVNTLYEVLMTRYLPAARKEVLMVSQIRDHNVKLVEFESRFGDAELRRQIVGQADQEPIA